LSPDDRLTFVAEGLPVILDSARGFWNAAQQLTEAPREAEVLTGFAEEEAAKILILMDIVRCPAKPLSGRMSIMLGWFYDRLTRLIYGSGFDLGWSKIAPSNTSRGRWTSANKEALVVTTASA
jgi:hypothetical protein